jgi:hypothetical protein
MPIIALLVITILLHQSRVEGKKTKQKTLQNIYS